MKRFYWAERVSFRLVYVIIFSLLFSPFIFYSCSADEINYQDLQFNGFQISQYTTYDDGTILLRIRPNSDGNCRADSLYFRLIRPDGSISPITLDTSSYNISSQNYCFVNSAVAFIRAPLMAPSSPSNTPLWQKVLFSNDLTLNTSSSLNDGIRVYGIARNYILISFLCGDSNSNVCGLVMDWTGKVLNSNINLGNNCDDVNIAQNINSNIGGFLWVCYMSSTSQLVWRTFGTPDATGTIIPINLGRINGITKF
ncbi:19_t:CDS:2, partial [Scutellospora calospora]